LHSLKQDLIAWYDKLRNFCHQTFFVRGKVDTTLFLKGENNDIILCATNESLCKDFSKSIQGEFKISLVG